MKFCPSCGTSLREGARFCEGCGAPVAADVTGAAEPAAVPAPPTPTPAPEPAAVQPTAVQPTAVQPTAVQPTAVQPTAEQPTAVQPTLVLPTEQPAAAPRSRRRLVTAIGGVAAVGVLGTVGYFVYDQLTGPGGGADSPQAAVLELSAAAGAEDAVTALSLLPPNEVGPLVELYQDVEAKAVSTGVIAKDKPMQGFDLKLDGVQVTTEELGDDVAAVTITGGTVSWTLDPDQLQGALRIQQDGDARTATEGSADLVEITQESSPGSPLRIMTVQRDGNWYVSPQYTLLEAWRTAEGLPQADFSKELDLEGTGADSGADAVRQAADAVADYDVDKLLNMLSPDEASALYHYRDAVTTALHREGALAELQSEGSIEFVSLDLVEGDEIDDRVPVTVRSASGNVYDDDGDSIFWSLDKNCVSWNDAGDTDGGCLDEAFDEMGLGADLAGRFEAATVLTEEVDGRWYLAPVATAVNEVRDGVAGMDADAVASLLGVPQFGGVDGTLADGASVDGAVAGWERPALYEMDVPAGSVFAPCLDRDDVYGVIYGPDGRPTGGSAAVATDGGRYRVLVVSGNSAPFSLAATTSTVEQVSVPTSITPQDDDACGGRVLSFEATAGQPIVFDAPDGDQVLVTTPSGEEVRTRAFVPEESGTHLLTIGAQNSVDIEDLSGDILTVGDSVTVVSGDGTESLRVFVPSGSEARISVSSNGNKSFAALLEDIDGGYSDSSGGSSYSNALVYSAASGSGLYTLELEEYASWYYSSGDDEPVTFQVTVQAY
ncbi:zinc ribbon domain-containing protein [Blastococcus sp. LR1]|uniref:zinc ribbon domain-containing protein n=1 Tax=Blastococcus sp. LR1 TaxID=2877000 RepID=UPI001CC8FBFD|nr:zinc ribbon domain-containing protein [Blastococcus sp. LR1]MCA0144899.1 zinc-ribbon domain-containing protein [Blastococcus sp. LR1]